MRKWLTAWLVGLALAALAGFWLGSHTREEVADLFTQRTPHEEYASALEESGLARSAMGRLWIRAARTSLRDAPRVRFPLVESGYLDPSRPAAVAYRFPARTGQRLTLELRVEPPSNALYFLDVYRAPRDSTAAPEHVISADSGTLRLEYEPGRDADLLIRIQPELLRGGRYTLRVTAEPTFAFPVDGRGVDAVQSFFGDPRDGGRRDHHGVDIFAPRGTPVLAATAGRVSSVRETAIGGRVVWLRDERGRQSVYYAHLETQLVERGQRVRPGDTLGLVGNSGNARSTPPHLHFGIYRRGRGPVDPLPFVRPVPPAPAPPALDPGQLGAWRRVTMDDVTLRTAPDSAGPARGQVSRDAPVRVSAIVGPWIRVAVPDGRAGFLPAGATEPARPIRTTSLESDAPLRDRPDERAAEVGRLEAGARIDVIGRLGDHLYVRAGDRHAWLPAAPAP
jgi:murein DD-endopeptidase MepM/ murein hydrolase activator NlpD